MKSIGFSRYYSHPTIPKTQKPPNSSHPRLNNLRNSNYSHLRTIKAEAEIKIRVCTNKPCMRQGARETLDILTGIAPPNVTVTSGGCLSKCGAGPNLVLLPGPLIVNHCGTAARAAEVMASVSGGGSAAESLAALALRNRAEEEMDKDRFSDAELLLSQAIDLKPLGGLHIIHKIRSSGRLALGNISGALEDAEEALAIAPQYPQPIQKQVISGKVDEVREGNKHKRALLVAKSLRLYVKTYGVTGYLHKEYLNRVSRTVFQAYLCQGDAFLALEEFDAAEKSYSFALQLDPSIRRSKSFKARVAKLEEKLTAANVAS